MRILLLLLPNLYDIFTLLMIGYAFFLHSQSKLQIPFLFACLLIYATTRVGIFAGKIVHMIIGKSTPEEEGEPMEPDVVAKKMILGVGPQCLFIIICQVIVALFFLQNPALAKMVTPDNSAAPQQQEQVQAQPEEQAQAPAEADKASENAPATETAAAKPSAAQDDEYDEDEEIVPAVPVKKQAVRTSVPVAKRSATPKKSEVKTTAKTVAQTNNNVYYDIPDRTLQTAGISPAERRAAYANTVNASSNVQTAASNWNYTAQNVSNTVRVAQTAPTQSTQSSNLQPKRYPGDDNPVNVHWGYYRYAESVPGGTQVNTTAAPSGNNAQNNGYRSPVPANTMRSIGY
ncbi:hypothetical protein IKP85_03220 [bacterium]|nr:hypothetical protein [bacterium]